MLTRTITYRDLDGKPITEDFYFHYSTAEATEMKIGLGDDIQDKIRALIKASNGTEIVAIFKDIISQSVGLRSDDKKHFIKTPAIRDAFMGSDAYSEFLLWLLKDEENMNAFVNGIFPANMNERVTQLVAEREKSNKTTIELPQQEMRVPDLSAIAMNAPKQSSPLGVPEKKLSEYTNDELLAMPHAEFVRLKTLELREFGVNS